VTAVAKTAEAYIDGARGAIYASPKLKARIMREVRSEADSPLHAQERTARRNMLVWPAYLVAAACAIVALALGWMNLSLNRSLHTAQAPHVSVPETQTVDDATLSDLVNEKAKRYLVPGGEIVRSNNRLYIAMHDIAAPPAGKVYQAWTQPKGSKTMVPGATFVPDKRGVAIVKLSANAAAQHAVAVSIEPPGGSKAPTTSPIVLELLE
jgi:anti-sigma-K factor RskA